MSVPTVYYHLATHISRAAWLPNPLPHLRSTANLKGLLRTQKNIKVCVTNLQGILSRKQSLAHLIGSVDLDIVLASETWLIAAIKNSEIFQPDIYELSHKDRTDVGVLIAAKKNLSIQDVSVNLAGEQILVKISRKQEALP